jgi:hypothetical protein
LWDAERYASNGSIECHCGETLRPILAETMHVLRRRLSTLRQRLSAPSHKRQACRRMKRCRRTAKRVGLRTSAIPRTQFRPSDHRDASSGRPWNNHIAVSAQSFCDRQHVGDWRTGGRQQKRIQPLKDGCRTGVATRKDQSNVLRHDLCRRYREIKSLDIAGRDVGRGISNSSRTIGRWIGGLIKECRWNSVRKCDRTANRSV